MFQESNNSNQKVYVSPSCDLITLENTGYILQASDDDNTGGTGHNMPWDD